MTSRLEIVEIVNLLKRLPNSPITGATLDEVKRATDETMTLFLAVLEDLPVEMVKVATIQYLSEGNPFFPTPGVIRNKAMDLQMLAAGVPTAAEAWGMVLTARQYIEPSFCEPGLLLRLEIGEKAGAEYVKALRESNLHDDACTICDKGGFKEIYAHPAVAETVRLLGGRDIILTDNPVADRARFIEAYREVLARERMRLSMTPRVAQFVDNERERLTLDDLDRERREIMSQEARRAFDTGEGVALLTSRMTK